MFSAGEKVSFLNEVGGGVIIKALPGEKYLILNDLGFEFAYSAKQLVAIEPKNSKQEIIKPISIALDQTQVKEKENSGKSVSSNSEANLKPENVSSVPLSPNTLSAGFVAIKGKTGVTSSWDLILFNSAPWEYYYSIRIQVEKIYYQLDHGNIHSREFLILNSFLPADIVDLKVLLVQAIPLNPPEHLNPEVIDHQFRIKQAKLYNDNLFKWYAEVENKIFVLPVEKRENSNPLIHIPVTKKPEIKPTKEIQFPKSFNSIEIDLHIEKIYQNHHQLENYEKLALQIKTVKQQMDLAFLKNYKKITFIHGVGEGKLKEETRKIISAYSNITIVDGDYGKYGFGATTVFID